MGWSELLLRGLRNPNKVPPFVYYKIKQRWRILSNRLPPLWRFNKKDSYESLTVEPHPQVHQPALDGSEIEDFAVDWVADPFIHYENGKYYLFAEAAKAGYPNNGACLVWYESDNGLYWCYKGVLLDMQPNSDMTDSYPQLISHQGKRYMVPSFARGREINDLQIYNFKHFPSELKLADTAIHGEIRGDPTLFQWDWDWYCIFEDFDYNLRLYYSDSLIGSGWYEHPSSPIENKQDLRPGGKPIVNDDFIDFFVQGPRSKRTNLLYYRITELSRESFHWEEVRTSPILYPASHQGKWNETNMHHISHTCSNGEAPIIAVDGQDRNNDYAIGVYQVSPQSTYQISSTEPADHQL
ncbi:hypothetical protein [Halorubrum sp. SD626R]|uniref:glucosamine inositolphosphorylceramide transferase family protein n=1 Tax=Halorubrum sp. SD626R TaxID=1419722 RepID=UPI000B06CD59|nr:hypothetical protein [Halorubrum sp. SD626R]TKX82274.1 hypothetical protein EXE53_01335 [Halorubrum sp. SD626R]